MGEFTLLDSWSESGTDLVSFERVIDRLDRSTFLLKTNTCNISLFSYRGKNEKGYLVWNLTDDSLLDFSKDGKITKAGIFPIGSDGMNPDLANESFLKAGFIVHVSGIGMFYFTREALNSFLARGDFKNSLAFKRGLVRDMFLLKGLHEEGSRIKPSDNNISIVYRKDRNMKKIFYCPSVKYELTSLKTLAESAAFVIRNRTYGRSCMHDWNVSHSLAEVCVSFPQRRKEIRRMYYFSYGLLPGISIMASNTGETSLTVQAMFWTKKSKTPVIAAQIKKKQGTTPFTTEDILAMIDEVVKEAEHFPAKLQQLTSTFVTMDNKENFEDITDSKAAAIKAVKFIFKDIGVVNVLQKARAQDLLWEICDAMESDKYYTLDEIAMLVMSTPGRLPYASRKQAYGFSELCQYVPDSLIKFKNTLNPEGKKYA